MNRLIREPLVHFALIGLVLYALDLGLQTLREDPNRIEITEAVTVELAAEFQKARGRLPDAAEMAVLRTAWLQNEVLFRQGLALRIDQGDVMIRERVIQKMSVLVHGGVVLDPPEDAVLRAWHAERQDTYTLPALMTFRLIQIDAPEAEARALAQRLNAAAESGTQPAGPRLRAVGFVNRPRGNVALLFGEAFTQALQTAPQGPWVALESPNGWQVALVENFTPALPQPFEDVADQVLADWRTEAQRAAAVKALEDLTAEYDVVTPPYDPATVDTDAVARLINAGNATAEGRVK